MPKAKTTREISDEHENHLVEVLARWNARRSPSSGAMFNDPIDVVSDAHVVECKATEGKSISIKKEDWIKNMLKSYNGKRAFMGIRFRDPYMGKHLDLALVNLDEYVELLEFYDNHSQNEDNN